MARSHPDQHDDGRADSERDAAAGRLPMSQHPNPFLRPRRHSGARPGSRQGGQPARPAHLPSPRSLPRSVPRPRPVRRGGMR